MGKRVDKIGSYESFIAPWETESGADAEIDKAKTKRLIFNARVTEAKALDEAEEAKEALAEAEKQVEEAKAEVEKASPEEANKKINRLEAANAALKSENAKLISDKEQADLRNEVIAGLDPKYAKYVTGDTREDLEKSLADVKADFGIKDSGSDNEDDEDDDNIGRTRPRPKLTNILDPKNGAPGEQEIDFSKVAESVFPSGF